MPWPSWPSGTSLVPRSDTGAPGPGGWWTILATHCGDEVVRAAPFSEIEIEIELGTLGADT